MNALAELVLELIGAGAGPSTDRSVVATATLASGALMCAVAWLSMTSADPLNETGWALAAQAGSFVLGAVGVLVSLLHLSRVPADRVLALVCLVINVTAVAVPVVRVMS